MGAESDGSLQSGGPQPGTPEVLADFGRRMMVYRCLNDSEWTMVWTSEGCRHVTGHDPSELIGSRLVSYTDLILPEDRLAVSVGVQTALARGTPFALDYRIRQRDGEVARVLELGVGVRDRSGAVASLEGVIVLATAG